jgi:tetratricopeptide (TPR) repeat protein
MNDPYKVLNVSPDATDAQVKQAYRDLARKYHPDNYAQNPLSDLAEEKMKEINEAYDTIMKMRSGNGAAGGASYGSNGSGGGSYGNQNQNAYGGTGIYARIRQYISAGNLVAAEQMLNSVPDRNAEWYFLNGALCYSKGWFDEALRNYETACAMDPGNAEYRQALGRMQAGGRAYRPPQGYGRGSMSSADCCCNLLMADCCCEMMGGDLIPCC